MVVAASWRRLDGMLDKSFDTLLAPKTLCTAANLAAPWSVPKWGAKMHPPMHFLLKNLQAPHGVAGEDPFIASSCVCVAMARLKTGPLRLFPDPPLLFRAFASAILVVSWSIMVIDSKREWDDVDAYMVCCGSVGEVHVGLVSGLWFEKEDV